MKWLHDLCEFFTGHWWGPITFDTTVSCESFKQCKICGKRKRA